MSVLSTPPSSLPDAGVVPAGLPAQPGIDPRGPQFVAGLTAATVAIALLVPTTVGLVIAAIQAVLFALGAVRGVQHTPQSWLFRTVVRPRLGPPDHLEDPAPPRFAQGVGLVFATVAVLGFVSGAVLLAQVALGLALAAAVLNAGFRFCLGCELYLLLKRAGGRAASVSDPGQDHSSVEAEPHPNTEGLNT